MADSVNSRPQRRPEWLRVPPRDGPEYHWLKKLMRSKQLHTVCEEANCPNLGECLHPRLPLLQRPKRAARPTRSG